MAKVPRYDLTCKKCGYVAKGAGYLRYVKYIQGRCPRCKYLHRTPARQGYPDDTPFRNNNPAMRSH
jgi:phage FluMu protein Com